MQQRIMTKRRREILELRDACMLLVAQRGNPREINGAPIVEVTLGPFTIWLMPGECAVDLTSGMRVRAAPRCSTLDGQETSWRSSASAAVPGSRSSLIWHDVRPRVSR